MNFLLTLALLPLLHGAYETDAFTVAPAKFVSQFDTALPAESVMNRRESLIGFGTFALMTAFSEASALDFDAFEKGQIVADTKNCNPKLDPKCQPKLSPDEALCQYGNSGQARGEACRRVRDAGGKLPELKKEKSLGGAYAM